MTYCNAAFFRTWVPPYQYCSKLVFSSKPHALVSAAQLEQANHEHQPFCFPAFKLTQALSKLR